MRLSRGNSPFPLFCFLFVCLLASLLPAFFPAVSVVLSFTYVLSPIPSPPLSFFAPSLYHSDGTLFPSPILRVLLIYPSSFFPFLPLHPSFSFDRSSVLLMRICRSFSTSLFSGGLPFCLCLFFSDSSCLPRRCILQERGGGGDSVAIDSSKGL